MKPLPVKVGRIMTPRQALKSGAELVTFGTGKQKVEIRSLKHPLVNTPGTVWAYGRDTDSGSIDVSLTPLKKKRPNHSGRSGR